MRVGATIDGPRDVKGQRGSNVVLAMFLNTSNTCRRKEEGE